MNTYQPRPDGLPDKIITGMPVIKPDLFKVWGFSRRRTADGPDELWITINFHDRASDPETGETLYHLCSQVILPGPTALVLAQSIMVNALFKQLIGKELSERFASEIIDAAYELGKKLDTLLDEYKKRDDEEHARNVESPSPVNPPPSLGSE